MRSNYFPDKPEVELEQRDVLAFICAKDESTRFPYFLEYYRNLGVQHFFVIDNNSSDGMPEMLEQEDDVTVFRSKHSYKGTGAGRDLLHELCDHYGSGHWCLTLDVDELLLYPGCEYLSLPGLCEFLEAEGSEGLYSVFLDFYSDKPLSKTFYEAGTPFFETCPWYEVDSYRLDISQSAPFVSIFGGPRWRKFWEASPEKRGPAMRKVPLAFWREGFSYVYSTHSHTDMKLASITGVLAHFKFFSEFKDRTEKDNIVGDRRQGEDYARYHQLLKNDPTFHGPHSLRFTGSRDLCKGGVMAVSDLFTEHIKPTLAMRDTNYDLAIGEPSEARLSGSRSGSFGIGALRALWPFFIAGRVAEYRHQIAKPVFSMRRRVDFMASKIRVEWVQPNRLALLVPEPVRDLTPGDEYQFVLTTDNRKTVMRFGFDDLELLELSTVPNIYAVDLVDHEQFEAHNFILRLERVATRDYPTMGAVVGRFPNANHKDYAGSCQFIAHDNIIGWLREEIKGSWNNPVVGYIDGYYVGRASPKHRRRALDRSKSDEAYGFKLSFNREFFDPEAQLVLQSAYGGRPLRGSPVRLHGANRRWNASKTAWERPQQKSTEPGDTKSDSDSDDETISGDAADQNGSTDAKTSDVTPDATAEEHSTDGLEIQDGTDQQPTDADRNTWLSRLGRKAQ